ncbi:aminotransferase class I/II-fold pyridoxal phosphate-dependent enzyme [Streptomyces sp. NPDC017941]|uniref:aminotransferase class I/II-fold pyridoxal phosphate-dependent enzyme n=1 Tax=Streptomyces sp. NPDC017941 TaxID=3365018 RepID=UPI00378F336D
MPARYAAAWALRTPPGCPEDAALWINLSGSLHTLTARLADSLGGRLRLSDPVTGISAGGPCGSTPLIVHTADGAAPVYDRVIVAAPAWAAARMLTADPVLAERAVLLDRLPYEPVTVALHRDARYMPPERRHWSAVTVHAHDDRGEPTYWFAAAGGPDVFKSWITHRDEPADVLRLARFRLPVLTADAIAIRRKLHDLRLSPHLQLAGSHLYDIDSQESAVRSALSARRRSTRPPPGPPVCAPPLRRRPRRELRRTSPVGHSSGPAGGRSRTSRVARGADRRGPRTGRRGPPGHRPRAGLSGGPRDSRAPDRAGHAHERVDDARSYSDKAGYLTARTAVAKHFRARLGLPGGTPSDVRLGNGVSELALLTLHSLLDPGDEVLVPDPGYPMWSAYTSVCGGTVVPYPCPESDGWRPDPDAVSRLAGPRTRALVVINPVNPTGASWSARTLEGLAVASPALLAMTPHKYDENHGRKRDHEDRQMPSVGYPRTSAF